jgi:RNA polymerase sigma factor (sigma-70 family)
MVSPLSFGPPLLLRKGQRLGTLAGMNDTKLRALAHANLIAWAEGRDKALEGLGGDGVSITERMRQRAHGGGGSTRPHQLTGPERQASAADKVLRVEQAVRQLDDRKRSVIRWKYLEGGPVSEWAKARGIPQQTAADLVNRAMLEVGRDLWFGNGQRGANRAAYHARREREAARIRTTAVSDVARCEMLSLTSPR